MNVRELGKARRRNRILEAARQLIVAGGVEGLSMRRLAVAAEVSTGTLYNLYGAKEPILYALFNEGLDGLSATLDRLALDDPIDRSRAIVTVSIEQFTANGTLYRPVIAALDFGSSAPEDRAIRRRCRLLQEQAIAAATAEGFLTADVEPALLAHQILSAYSHAVRHWARGLFDDTAFHTQVLHCWALVLMAVATPAARPRLQAELDAVAPQVSLLVRALDGAATADAA